MGGHLGPRDLCLNKVGKGLLSMQSKLTKFQASEQSGSEKEDFEYFPMYFYGSNLGHMWRGHLGPCSLDLNKLASI